MALRIKRVYEEASPDDGKRILVDRLWPRGLTKEQAAIDIWLKDIAPSDELRKWFAHDPAKWSGFQKRFCQELDANTSVVETLRQTLAAGPATLVYAAKNETHNNAVVIKSYLD